MNIVRVCNRIITASFYLLFILVPLILTPWNYELFEFNKMIITYALTISIVTAWIIKMAATGQVIVRRTILDIPLFLFVLSQLVSSFFSMDPHVSWFGYYSRFNGGMLSIFCYVLLYYAFVSNWNDTVLSPEKSLLRFLRVMLATGVIVSMYGVLERLGIDKHIWVQDVQNRVFSTLGQPNWLAAYLVALMPIVLGFAMRPFLHIHGKFKYSPSTFLYIAVYLLFFVTLLFTRSRSGMAGFGTSMGVFFLVGWVITQAKKPFVISFFVINTAILGIVFFHGTNIEMVDKYITLQGIQSTLLPKQPSTTPNQPTTTSATQPSGTLLEYGGTESGTIRKYVWQAAIIAWRSSVKTILSGTGTETFAFAFFQHKPIGHNLTSEWDFLYNKAHNEYLNYLTTTGILGLVTYLMIIISVVVWFFRVHGPWFMVQSNRSELSENNQSLINYELLSLSVFSSWISVLVTNFFGFSVVIIQIFFFLFPAFIAIFCSTNIPLARVSFHLPNPSKKPLAIIALLAGIALVGYIGVLWTGDYFFSNGYRLSRAGKLVDAYTNLTQATALRPNEPLYYDELSVVLGTISVASLEAGNATAASELAKQSLHASDIALSLSPNNVNFWKSRTKIYFGFSSLDSKFVEAAKASLEKAGALSPNDPKITYNLAVLEGRLGKNDTAIELLKKTIALKPNYRDAYFALNIFYQETNQKEFARETLQEYLQKVDPNDKEFQEKITTQ